MDTLSDDHIMLKVQEGHLSFAGLLFERYKKILYRFFYNQTGHATMSEDLVQITFYRLIKYKNNFTSDSHFKAWIFTIARNAMMTELKKNKKSHQDIGRYEDRLPAGEQTDSGIVAQEKQNLLQQALNQLSPEKREILILIKLNGKKYKEVAEILDMNESTVKSKVFRAIKELQEYYNYEQRQKIK